MIVACPNCTTRLQLEDAKVPARPFTVRCPKCQQVINAQPPSIGGAGSALAAGSDLPASARATREGKSGPAPAFFQESLTAEAEVRPTVATGDDSDLARLLAALLQRGGASAGQPESGPATGTARRPAWEPRRALVCVGAEQPREIIASGLSNNRYEVCVAIDTTHAIERMREDKMDVVVLDAEFDVIEQGAAFINREISSLRPAERRRLVFVQFSPSARTADAHAALLANVNLIVNHADAAQLPRLLERCIRDLNELYHDLNKVLNVTDL